MCITQIWEWVAGESYSKADHLLHKGMGMAAHELPEALEEEWGSIWGNK